MLEEIPAQAFSEWIAYYQLEPFGMLAEDAMWSQWEAIYVNSHRKKGTHAKKIKDFLLFRNEKKDASKLYEETDEEELLEYQEEGGLNG